MDYQLKRSDRRSISIEISEDKKIIVRAPNALSLSEVERFLMSKEKWISRHLLKTCEDCKQFIISKEQIPHLRKRAKEELTEKVYFWSKRTGLTCKDVRINSARTHFGCCTSRNVLWFPFWLVLLKEDQIDYVVLHELCHTAEHNHSPRFYALLESVMPNWKEKKDEMRNIRIITEK